MRTTGLLDELLAGRDGLVLLEVNDGELGAAALNERATEFLSETAGAAGDETYLAMQNIRGTYETERRRRTLPAMEKSARTRSLRAFWAAAANAATLSSETVLELLKLCRCTAVDKVVAAKAEAFAWANVGSGRERERARAFEDVEIRANMGVVDRGVRGVWGDRRRTRGMRGG